MKHVRRGLSLLVQGMARHPRLMVAMATFLLIFLIGFAGNTLGLEKPETRLFLIASVLLVWSLFLAVDIYRMQRGAKQLEQSLQLQGQEYAAGSRPDRKEEIQQLAHQFEEAVAALKQSKLGKGRTGKAALYALPWYMFIGPPASGKSTALLHSGLQFPYLGRRNRGVQGVGGTRNCDWWFTSEAVLLDTAGRYVTEEEDREEWCGFLDLLKRYRGERPINGVLAAISIADLLDGGEDALEASARKMRERIDELIQRLGIVFPVYLLFTKCDLIRGFVEFYEDFSKTDREQIWGATLPKSPAADFLPQKAFEAEFDRLIRALDARRLTRLSGARGAQKSREIFGFPLQIALGQEKIARFVEQLFARNPYEENPVFRGFYFTSGTQEGKPIDRILAAVSRASGLSEGVAGVFEEETEPKAYFLKTLFTEVIFPDQILAGPTRTLVRQQGILRVGVFVGAVFAAVLSLAGLLVSFLGNRVYLDAIRLRAAQAAKIKPNDERRFPENIERLEQIREGVVQLEDDREKGIPFRLRGGLYQGGTLFYPMRDLYFQHIHQLLMKRTQNALEVELARFAAGESQKGRNFEDYYIFLKIYLMLSDSAHHDGDFLDRELRKIWSKTLAAFYANRIPQGLFEQVAQQIAFYSHAPAREEIPLVIVDKTLVQRVRDRLRVIPLEARLYARIRREGIAKGEPYTLQTLLRGQRGGELFLGDYKIPAFFTEPGWRGSYLSLRDQLLDGKGGGLEAWVLDEPPPDRTRVEQGIEKLYFEEYQRQWLTFLESVRLRFPADLAETARFLDLLSGDDSALVALLVEVDRHTDLRKGDLRPAAGALRGMIGQVRDKFGLGSETAGTPSSVALATPVATRFKFLHDFVIPVDPQNGAPVAGVVMELQRMHDLLRPIAESGDSEGITRLGQGVASGQSNDLILAERNVERLLQPADHAIRRILEPLLLEPFKRVSAGVVGGWRATLNRQWRDEVYESCRQGIAGRYPFKRGGEEATFSDITEFFHPESGLLWRFYEKEIKAFVEEGHQSWRGRGTVARSVFSEDFLEWLRKARILSESLFPRGHSDLHLSFDLYPHPASGVTEVLLAIDGKEFRYRNEPQEWREFPWPGPSSAPGARLQIQRGGMWLAMQQIGRWGFFKLLDDARMTPLNNTSYQIEWALKGPDGKITRARYDLRAQSVKNPFKPGFFSEVGCRSQIG